MSYCIVLTTCSNLKNAENLAKKILEKKLAACIQMSEIKSLYSWNNEIQNDKEVKLTIKTRENKYTELEIFIKQNHEYETPQILQIEIKNGNKEYLDWVDNSV